MYKLSLGLWAQLRLSRKLSIKSLRIGYMYFFSEIASD
jgi:hypothetical protein